MGVRNKKREILRRLDSKTLDAGFLNEIQNGLNCSPFEAEAVLARVYHKSERYEHKSLVCKVLCSKVM